MIILFCMEHLGEAQFRDLPGVKKMTAEFAACDWDWGYRQLKPQTYETEWEKADDPLQMIVTDSPLLAQQAKAAGICCVGYQEENDTGFFPAVEYVVNSFEGVDATFFANALRRFHGLTAVIAQTERLIVRESCESDFPAFYQISRENAGQCCGEIMSENYEEEKEKFLAYIGYAYNYFGYGLWTVLERETGAIVGRCGLNPVADHFSPQGRMELGYLIAKDYRRRGYAEEACRNIIEYGFEVLDCPVLYAMIHRENYPSQALAAKLGFQKENGEAAASELELWRKNRTA